MYIDEKVAITEINEKTDISYNVMKYNWMLHGSIGKNSFHNHMISASCQNGKFMGACSWLEETRD